VNSRFCVNHVSVGDFLRFAIIRASFSGLGDNAFIRMVREQNASPLECISYICYSLNRSLVGNAVPVIDLSLSSAGTQDQECAQNIRSFVKHAPKSRMSARHVCLISNMGCQLKSAILLWH